MGVVIPQLSRMPLKTRVFVDYLAGKLGPR